MISLSVYPWQAFKGKSTYCRQGLPDYLSEAPFSCSILWWAPVFTQERLVSDKHSSLLHRPINYRRKTFYNISPSQSVLLGVGERKKKVKAGTPYWRGRLRTVDLLVLTSLNRLLFILKRLFTFLTKHPTSIRRSTVLSLLPHLVFPVKGTFWQQSRAEVEKKLQN